MNAILWSSKDLIERNYELRREEIAEADDQFYRDRILNSGLLFSTNQRKATNVGWTGDIPLTISDD